MKSVYVKSVAVGCLIFGAVGRLRTQTNSSGLGAALKLAPADPEMMPSYWESHAVAIIACITLSVLFLALFIWLCLKPKPVNPVPPRVVAYDALVGLLARPENGDCLSRVSQITRHYFIAAFEIPAGEPTTAEFCALLTGNRKLSPDLKFSAANFLKQCDDHKFGTKPDAKPVNAVARALELIGLAEKHLEATAQKNK
jgi:hypothetical protein